MSWIIIGKIMQSILGMVISMLTARFLGPSNFGVINYASAIATFMIPIMQLGFNNVMVYELKKYPEEEGQIIGTVLILSAVSSLFCISCCTSFVLIANFGEKETIVICVLYSLMLFFQSFDLIQYWFQAKLLSKYSSIASLIAYLVMSVYKIFLLATGKNVVWFALSNSFDYIFIALLCFVFYKKKQGQKLSFSAKVGKRIFGESKHYIIPGLMVTIYGQTDKIMLKLMVENSATGFYSTALSCVSISGFVFNAIIDSFRPVIFEAKQDGREETYEKRLSTLYHIVAYLGIIQSLVLTIFAKWVIDLLYGADYAEASPALQILCWYVIFSYFGSIRNIWMLSENKQKYLWIINLIGAALNVALNFALIPFFGVRGAAVASLSTEVLCNFALGFVFPPIRKNSFIMLKGLNPLFLLKYLRRNNDEKN